MSEFHNKGLFELLNEDQIGETYSEKFPIAKKSLWKKFKEWIFGKETNVYIVSNMSPYDENGKPIEYKEL